MVVDDIDFVEAAIDSDRVARDLDTVTLRLVLLPEPVVERNRDGECDDDGDGVVDGKVGDRVMDLDDDGSPVSDAVTDIVRDASAVALEFVTVCDGDLHVTETCCVIVRVGPDMLLLLVRSDE